MRLHYLQHVAFETPGYILDWAAKNDHSVSHTFFFEENYTLPSQSEFDILVIMGGPMNIYEEEEFPYLKEEKAFIKQAIEEKKKIIGICLGAQLIADVLGAKIYKNPIKEIGWIPVAKNSGTDLFPDSFTPLHWHGDTFELPKGSTLLASSDDCVNQAFLYSNHVLGLQFHLESTNETLTSIIENCASELSETGNIMQKEEMMQLSKEYIPLSNQLMDAILLNMVK